MVVWPATVADVSSSDVSILRPGALLRWLILSASSSGALGAQAPTPPSALVFGTVTDSSTGAPVRIVAVRELGSETSTLTDDDGRYRLDLGPGAHRLEFRRLGYRPASIAVTIPTTGLLQDVSLVPIARQLAAVVVKPEDDAARRIIAAAIARKQRLRGQVHDYRYDASVRFVVRDLKKPADSASSILVITESRTSTYWEQPDRYQETILARRQTGNLDAQRNLVSVGEIVNFNRERIQLGRYEIVSPIADDALDHYDYRILDTLSVAGRYVLRLSLEPRPDGSPAFAGVIDIADSTFDVTGLDVGVNDAVRLGFLRNVRYRQQFKEVAQDRWMPYSIELTANLQLRIPIPGVPSRLSVQHVAALSGFRFDEGQRPAGLGEYRVIVADNADRPDNRLWAVAPELPLSAAETAAWHRIDSIAEAPPTLRRRAIRTAVATAAALNNPDFFHYNRVDGAYLGAGWSWRDPPGLLGTIPTAKLGRATGSERWQYRAGDQVRLDESRRVWLGATYHDETVSRPTLTSPGYNATTRALFSRIDPLDYYRERGLVATLTTKLFDLTQLNAAYTDARQTSLPDVVTGPLFGGRNPADRPIRPNDPIADGQLRTLSAGVSYDSRPMLHQNGVDSRLGAAAWTRVSIDAEGSARDVLASDFDYRRYTLRVERRQQSFGMGVTTFMAVGGIGTAGLPPQRYFTVDGGARVLETQASPFGTLADSNFTGSRAAMLAVEHNFDRLLFTRSQLPLVRDIPFTLAVRAAVFWTSFGSRSRDTFISTAAPTTVRLAPSPYREVGFTVGNLTPFMSPINLAVRLAWQLSNYPTGRFRIGLDLGR